MMHSKSLNCMKAAAIGLALSLAGATGATASCVDAGDGPKRAPFEIVKAAVLNGNFESAAGQIDLGGNRENNIQASLSRLSRLGITAFSECILLRRKHHSENFTSEIVYYSDGAQNEYWLLISGVQVNGETRLIDVVLSNDYKRFREWLQ